MNIVALVGMLIRHQCRLGAMRLGNLVGGKRTKVAFIGLGNMGAGMAGRIVGMGYDLTVWNRTAEKAKVLGAAGAKVASSAAYAVREADIVITSLMDDASVLEMANGMLLKAMKPGAIHLCVTTISPGCAETLAGLHAEAGAHYVSGPVIGRPDAAAAGRLVTYLGGADAPVRAVMPVCESYAMMSVHISERPAVANSMKLIVNYAGVSIIEILGETYAFAEKCGIPLSHVQQFFQMALAHPAMKMYAEKVRTRDYTGNVGFTMSGGLKDVRLMLAAANEAGVGFEIGKIIERKMVKALSGDLAAADWSAICEVTRRESGFN